jgi:hypothetical protein
VEIFHRGKRVASHMRSFAAYHHSTVHEHMPKSHQAHLEWTPSRRRQIAPRHFPQRTHTRLAVVDGFQLLEA